MPLDDIPCVSKDYPLFDWSEYPSSRDALVKDHLVSDFKKETWNDIIYCLARALVAAGLEWDDTYTNQGGAEIFRAYGELSAEKFNSVRFNIEKAAPIKGWGWAYNRYFRGYTGREDFRGYAEYGRNCDKLYPEYIIELVRRLNLLIELMRDTANTANFEYKTPIGSVTLGGATKHFAPNLVFSDPSSSMVTGILLQRIAGSLRTNFLAESKILSDLMSLKSMRLSLYVYTKSVTGSEIAYPDAFILRGRFHCFAKHHAKIITSGVSLLGHYFDLIKSNHVAEIDVHNSVSLYYDFISKSLHLVARMLTPEAKPMGWYGERIFSLCSSDALAVKSKPIPENSILIKAESSGEIIEREPISASASFGSETSWLANQEKIRPIDMETAVNSGSTCFSVLDSAWLPPI